MSKYNFDLDLNVRNSLSLIIERIKPNSKVLEFGPANGRMTKYLQQELGCSLYAVELDKEAAKDATRYCEEIIIGNIEDYDWLDLYQNIKFDYIIFADVLEHLYYPQKVLERSKQLLDEQGSILFSIPNIAHNTIIMELLQDRFTYHSVGLLDDTHIRFFTKFSLDELVEKIDMYKTYETAVFLSPEHTEFHKSYEEYPQEISMLLQHRVFGEVYQYVYELKLHKEKLISDLRVHREFKLFYDDGHGFCEENIIVAQFENDRAFFDLSLIDKYIQAIRIDPLEKAVKFQMESLLIDDIEYIDHVQHNGVLEDGLLLFYHLDPQIIVNFDNNKKIDFIEVKLRDFCILSNYLDKLIELKNKVIIKKDQKLNKINFLLNEKKEEIKLLEQRCYELEKLVNSMQIKNRIKNLFQFKKKQ